MVDIQKHANGCILRVRAQPGAKKNGLIGVHNGALRVAVTAAAEQGKANKAVVKTLAKGLGLKKSQLVLINGRTSRDKKFLIYGVTASDLANLVARVAVPHFF